MADKKQYEKTVKDINKEDLEGLREILSKQKKEVEEVTKPILFDGRQYSVRIPKKFAEAIHVNPKTQKFKFELQYQSDASKLPILRGVVINERGE